MDIVTRDFPDDLRPTTAVGSSDDFATNRETTQVLFLLDSGKIWPFPRIGPDHPQTLDKVP